MKLTVKQQRFADEWLANGGNATQAAIDAGYSKKTARSIGQENLTKPDIRAYIDERLAAIDEARVAKGTEVLEFLTEVMRGGMEETYIDKDGIQHGYVSQKNQIKAAEILARYHGLMTQNIRHEGDLSITFVEDLED